MEHIALIIAILGLINLVVLSVIDLRTWLLPDPLNATLALLGIGFHFLHGFSLLSPIQITEGVLVGAGILYGIRAAGNWYYKQDTLGLGDVKLLAAAGCWLGPIDVVMAMTIGAFAGLLHGIIVALAKAAKEKAKPDMHRLMIPAGPGFCIGILISCIWKYFPL